MTGENRNSYGIVLENPKDRDHLEDRLRFEYNIKTGLKGIWSEGVDWIHLT
jgi:hypothetical protein